MNVVASASATTTQLARYFPVIACQGPDRHRQEQLDGAEAVLIGPQAHPDRRPEDHEEPRVEEEEAVLERGLLDLEEAPVEEREPGRQGDEDDDEHVGEHRAEVAADLAFEDDPDVAECTHGKLLVLIFLFSFGFFGFPRPRPRRQRRLLPPRRPAPPLRISLARTGPARVRAAFRRSPCLAR